MVAICRYVRPYGDSSLEYVECLGFMTEAEWGEADMNETDFVYGLPYAIPFGPVFDDRKPVI